MMVLRALIVLVLGTLAAAVSAQQAPCDSAAFREAVAAASASITQLHESNGRLFHENLEKLRALNNWQEAEYVANAAPFVKDETTAALDTANQALLAKVQSLDPAGANTESGRCSMLNEVKAAMEKVVANTSAKWEHMLRKLARASAQPIQAGFNR
jgi:hypothetical protein